MSKGPFDTNSIANRKRHCGETLHNHFPPRVNHRSEPLAIMIIIWPYCMMSHPHNYHDSLINYSPGIGNGTLRAEMGGACPFKVPPPHRMLVASAFCEGGILLPPFAPLSTRRAFFCLPCTHSRKR
ncbi:hypothetical protein CDAR_497451 [Caerostris darwini]|uniref:Uncharacterized protein n=1 Tax=Caerostris darwini TaxID=1538125 RepID=A0AAV4RZ70_9ARAC|nr:hypothetical protein CDAR_497451 [Caerostris darwini]